MSGKVTEASQRRMDEAAEFVQLQPGPYFEIVDPTDGLARLRITIEGREESTGIAMDVAAGIEEWVNTNVPALVVEKRRTA